LSSLCSSQKTPVTTVDQVTDLLQAAERLDAPSLTTQTVADAADLLSTSTAVALSSLSWSAPPGLEPLQAASFEFLRAHFDALRVDAELLSDLPTPIFRALVVCPALVVQSENSLLRVVWRRLAAADHSRADVEALLGAIRLRLLHASSLSTLSRVARGEATSALPAPPPAVQAGAAAVALRGLPTLAAVGVDDGAPLEARRVARNSEPGTSACVVFRLDQTRTELSPVFHAGGHEWQLKVQLHGEANLDLDIFLWLLSHPASESTVDATVMMWAHAVDGGRRVRLTEGEEEVRFFPRVLPGSHVPGGRLACVGAPLVDLDACTRRTLKIAVAPSFVGCGVPPYAARRLTGPRRAAAADANHSRKRGR